MSTLLTHLGNLKYIEMEYTVSEGFLDLLADHSVIIMAALIGVLVLLTQSKKWVLKLTQH